MKKRFNILIYLIVVILGIGLGEFVNFVRYEGVSNQHEEEKEKDWSKNPNELIGENGIRVLALKETEKLNEQYTLNFEENGDFNYIFKVLNGMKEAQDFEIELYIDYKQISFDVNGSSFKIYKCNVSENSHLDIPVKFEGRDLLDKSHILILHLRNVTDKLEDKLDFFCRYNLTNDLNYEIQEAEVISPDDNYISSDGYIGIELNKDMDEKKLSELNVINSLPGEKIKIPIEFGGKEDVENYLVWVTINGEEIKPLNIQGLMNFKVPKENIIIKNIEIEAPEKKGDYKIQFNIVLNPWLLLSNECNEPLSLTSSDEVILRVE